MAIMGALLTDAVTAVAATQHGVFGSTSSMACRGVGSRTWCSAACSRARSRRATPSPARTTRGSSGCTWGCWRWAAGELGSATRRRLDSTASIAARRTSLSSRSCEPGVDAPGRYTVHTAGDVPRSTASRSARSERSRPPEPSSTSPGPGWRGRDWRRRSTVPIRLGLTSPVVLKDRLASHRGPGHWGVRAARRAAGRHGRPLDARAAVPGARASRRASPPLDPGDPPTAARRPSPGSTSSSPVRRRRGGQRAARPHPARAGTKTRSGATSCRTSAARSTSTRGPTSPAGRRSSPSHSPARLHDAGWRR